MRSEMVEAMENAMRSQVNSLHVALPATIMGYDGSTGLCQVKPIGKVKKGSGTVHGSQPAECHLYSGSPENTWKTPAVRQR